MHGCGINAKTKLNGALSTEHYFILTVQLGSAHIILKIHEDVIMSPAVLCRNFCKVLLKYTSTCDSVLIHLFTVFIGEFATVCMYSVS